MCQVVPFQTSARFDWVPTLLPCSPTASQKVAETQDTALSTLAVAPGGAAARWRPQALPFQPSVRAREVLLWFTSKSPADSQERAEAQETALRTVAALFAGLGVDWSRQAEPFQTAAP